MKTQHLNNVIDMQEDIIEISEIDKIIKNKNILSIYENKYTNKLYQTILKSLTHEQYESEEVAKKTFNRILIHKDEMNKLLNRDVGIMVATIDYLSNIINSLNEPKVIEEDKSETLIEISLKDKLTDLFTRDIFDIMINKHVDNFKRTGYPLSLIMFDIDDFKKINDTYGHQKGDEVLSKIGQLLNSNIREMDIAARYGGEEFVVLLPHTKINKSFDKAEKIRQEIENMQFDDFSITVSVGVSQTNKSIDSASSLIETADYSMYQAKRNGKNRVEKNSTN